MFNVSSSLGEMTKSASKVTPRRETCATRKACVMKSEVRHIERRSATYDCLVGSDFFLSISRI